MPHLQDQKRLNKLYEKCLDGEYEICSECDGTGKNPNLQNPTIYSCDKCWGAGILDWVERIMGKECPFEESGRSTSSSSSSSSSSQLSYSLPSQKSVKDYIDQVEKRRNYEYNNSIRSRTVQRFHQMSHKFKRCMQRRRYQRRNN